MCKYNRYIGRALLFVYVSILCCTLLIQYNKKTYTSLLLPYQGPDLISNIQIDVVSAILTELNLMTYDFHV